MKSNERKVLTGIVKEYDASRGCGIIVENGSRRDYVVFANYVYMKRGCTLIAGQDVEFELQDNLKEIWAINVRVLLQPKEDIVT